VKINKIILSLVVLSLGTITCSERGRFESPYANRIISGSEVGPYLQMRAREEEMDGFLYQIDQATRREAEQKAEDTRLAQEERKAERKAAAENQRRQNAFHNNPQGIEYIFAHDLKKTKEQMNDYVRNGIVPRNKSGGFNGLEVNEATSSINLSRASFGQEADIAVVTQGITSSQGTVVGVGVGKGAATWINAAAQQHKIGKIRALVIESPFADANEIIYQIAYLNYVPGYEYIAKFVGKFVLPKYDFDGIQPITSIAQITNKNLPIFIIHSEQNGIPINHSRKLYVEFLRCGFTNVYLFDSEDQIIESPNTPVSDLVHKFYRAHQLPSLANAGDFLSQVEYKPSAEGVIQRINETEDRKPTICRFIIKALMTCYVVYKVVKHVPGVGTQLESYMFKLMQLLKTQFAR
jgi:hypothetical protein